MRDVLLWSVRIAMVVMVASCSSAKQMATIKQQGLSVVKDQARGLKDKATEVAKQQALCLAQEHLPFVIDKQLECDRVAGAPAPGTDEADDGKAVTSAQDVLALAYYQQAQKLYGDKIAYKLVLGSGQGIATPTSSHTYFVGPVVAASSTP